jgi:hypothetical protein
MYRTCPIFSLTVTFTAKLIKILENLMVAVEDYCLWGYAAM